MKELQTGFVTPADKAEWRILFNGYADFYDVALSDDTAETVWSWLHDPEHVMEGLVVKNAEGKTVGMAHVRACPRSLAGAEIGFLDDMYVLPEARGSGAADALFAALRTLATERHWGAIRWITQHFNARGRAFYDRYTNGPTDFIVYQWQQDEN